MIYPKGEFEAAVAWKNLEEYEAPAPVVVQRRDLEERRLRRAARQDLRDHAGDKSGHHDAGRNSPELPQIGPPLTRTRDEQRAQGRDEHRE